jgi:hypothetical protein
VSEHTPLPWVIDSEGKTSKIWENCAFLVHEISAPNSKTSHWVAYTQTDKEGDANTALIVTAVNSHDALVEALKEFVDHFGDPFKKARAALKLAGE